MSELFAPVLTLDGPSATGKGTVAAEVAKDCGWGLLDSGALYRAFAYIADQKGVVVDDDAAIRLLGNELDLKCYLGPEGTAVILWGDVTLTDQIRTESVAQRASYTPNSLPCGRRFFNSSVPIGAYRDLSQMVVIWAPGYFPMLKSKFF